MKRLFTVTAALASALLLAGCESADKAEMSDAGASGGMSPPFGGAPDMRRADRLWRDMRGYTNWDPYPELAGFQPGQSPHGRFLKYYINGTAARNPRNPGNGSIIVKENYTAQRDNALAAVTVMKKIAGYDPDNADWFWVKYAPDGSVMQNPKGMSLAGRVAKGMPQGCIACHSNARGGDYLFVND